MPEDDLYKLLSGLARGRPTRKLALRQGLVDGAADSLSPDLLPGPYLVVADPTTWLVAGERVHSALERSGRRSDRHLVQGPSPDSPPVAGEAEVEALEERLRLARPVLGGAVAVGAGTISDIVKLATFRSGLPYAVFPTAPSMNGYTSGIAAIAQRGVKTTVPSHPPVACLADLDILCNSPSRMIAAGLGDLVSRPVSVADWYLSHRLLGTDYSPRALELIDTSSRLVDGIGTRLPDRDPGAVAHLTAALLVSGLAMEAASTSAPASGGEHLISHFLDMTHTGTKESDFHGCQVGVGTLVTAKLYERLLGLDPSHIDVAARLAARPSWVDRATELAPVFGDLWPAVSPHALDNHASHRDLAHRLQLLTGEWGSLLSGLEQVLSPSGSIREALRSAGCPVTFADIGVSGTKARQALLYSRHIRSRYTVLDLLDELGLLAG